MSTPQLGILAAETWAPDPATYTVVSAVEVSGVPRWEDLPEAARRTIARHEVFAWQPTVNPAGDIIVTVEDSDGLAIEDVDLRLVDPEHTDTVIQERLRRERHRCIRVLERAARPHIIIIFFRRGLGNGVCALVTHHLFVDEHAVDLLWNEIFRRVAGQPVPTGHDLRYRHWALTTISAHARTAARKASMEAATALRDATLTTVHTARKAESTALLRFTIPPEVTDGCARKARAVQVPVAAVYGAAFGDVLCTHFRSSAVTVAVPASRRADLADHDVVGCYVNTVWVPARPAADTAATIRRWHQDLQFAAARSHADAAQLRPILGGEPHAMLSFESRAGRRATGPVRWHHLPPPDSPAKAGLTCFLAPGIRHGAGDGRLLWRDGVLNDAAAARVTGSFLDTLARFAGLAPDQENR
ncbi:condensation domain-containing protein [Micromonospora profundi]|uniref:condensation domain-containing protein n=1 Tax=Micromonospora profundi TaxID=1420889 RepID=UPI00365B3555